MLKKIINFIKLDKQSIFIIVAILSFKSFAFNPSMVPTGSMMPTIDEKSLIVVDVHSYGIKIPFTKITLIDINDPQRGDIAVFRFPVNESTNYIKRIVAVPGDTIYFNETEYFVNNKPSDITKYQFKTVPADNYFAIGDNILHSYDSRFWGFVPKENLIGKYAFTVVEINKIIK
jgi:signal peptidase I